MRIFYKALICLSLFFSLTSKAQIVETFYEDGTLKSKGKVVVVSRKSTIAGKQTLSLKIGLWQYFDTLSTLIKTENYAKSGNETFLNGEVLYYSGEGVLLKQENYRHDVMTEERWLDTGIYEFGNLRIEFVRNSDKNLEVREYRNGELTMEKLQENGQITLKKSHRKFSRGVNDPPKMFESNRITEIEIGKGETLESKLG
ncbi:MAG: hypothetical protein H7321_05635, partial [Bacteroidia bacterium]|nr:hypothetical protein [Bacteroidia bacterium]